MEKNQLRARSALRGDAASTRRLSGRDVRELARLTAELKVSGATGFERRGVVVHLMHQNPAAQQERVAGQQEQPGGADSGVREQSARLGSARSPRQQRRYTSVANKYGSSENSSKNRQLQQPSPACRGQVLGTTRSTNPAGRRTFRTGRITLSSYTRRFRPSIRQQPTRCKEAAALIL